MAPAIASASRRPSRSGATHRSSSSGRSGRPNVSATGPGPNTGPLGARLVAERGDRPALQQHDAAVVVDRPLDVLRTAERRRGPAREPSERRRVRRAAQRGGRVVAGVAQAAARRQGQLDAVDLRR